MLTNKKVLTLVLVAIALAGTTSYASTKSDTELLRSDPDNEEWNPNVVMDSRDSNLELTAQGANTYAMVDPGCGPCIAAQMAQLKLGAKTGAKPGVPSQAPTEAVQHRR